MYKNRYHLETENCHLSYMWLSNLKGGQRCPFQRERGNASSDIVYVTDVNLFVVSDSYGKLEYCW